MKGIGKKVKLGLAIEKYSKGLKTWLGFLNDLGNQNVFSMEKFRHLHLLTSFEIPLLPKDLRNLSPEVIANNHKIPSQIKCKMIPVNWAGIRILASPSPC